MSSLYRDIFADTKNKIDKKLSAFDGKNALETFLKEDLRQQILKSEEEIRAEFEKIKCKNCGKCCRFAVSEFSPDTLQNKAKNGDKTAKVFIETFSPYKTGEIPAEFSTAPFEGGYFYHCRKVEKRDGKYFCPDYKNRPSICQNFPDTPLEPLPEGCAYEEWKDKNEIKALYIRALNEIRKFYLDRLNQD